MRHVRNALLQTVVIGVLGTIMGFSTNALRAEGKIKPFFNYFDRTRGQPGGGAPVADGNGVPAEIPDPSGIPPSVPPTTPAVTAKSKKLDHDYQVATFEDMLAAFNDARYKDGLFVFVDARNDEAFGNGHIPGAIQADHYQLEKYIDTVKERAVAADKVFVYCNGGDCEDSIFMCGDLLEYGISKEVLHLYEGGWKEWEGRKMPVESTADRSE